MNNKKAIILFSGGADSATIIAIVANLGYEIHALSFNYLQRHNIELEKAKNFLQSYNIVNHKIIEIDLKIFGNSALTDDNIAVPKYNTSDEIKDTVPITYVPARNTIFLSYALAFAEVLSSPDIFIGVHATDYANYPDCRPEFISSFEDMANLGTVLGTVGNKINIHTPLINMTKAEIIKTGLSLGVDYSNTLSCYDPSINGISCGTCHACLIRREAFLQNGVIDPIKYQS